ncbi:MAG: dockerin type I domain-containing protein [Planctomycetota bacterium]|nr:dockerin type I domain-containing protein [Planctomycetota bacterium]
MSSKPRALRRFPQLESRRDGDSRSRFRETLCGAARRFLEQTGDWLGRTSGSGLPRRVRLPRFEALEPRALLTLSIAVGDHTLFPNTADQWVEISATSSDPFPGADPGVTGFSMTTQIGDGAGPGPEPVFQAITNSPDANTYGWDFRGGIWDGNANNWMGGLEAGYEQYAQSSVVFTAANDQVVANGLVVRLHISTVGISTGTYDLKLKGADFDGQVLPSSAFIPSGTTNAIDAEITNGHLTIEIPPARILVSPISNPTTESGGTATFTVTLASKPLADVSVPLTSSDLTEGTVQASVTITPDQWQAGVQVTVTGVDDSLIDGNVGYTIQTGDPTSTDTNYDALTASDVADVTVVNNDNDVSNSGISGFVFVDANNDGVRDAAERGLPNVPIRLVGPASGTVTTAADGSYHFLGLPPGSYAVYETQPMAYDDGLENAQQVGPGTVGNDVYTDVQLSEHTLATEYNFGERGVRAEVLSLQFLFPKPHGDAELIQHLNLARDIRWFDFETSVASQITVSVPGDGQGLSLEIYTSDFLPVILGADLPVVSAQAAPETQYLAHVSGTPTAGGTPAVVSDEPLPLNSASYRVGNYSDLLNRYDVNDDGHVTAEDILIVITAINQTGGGLLRGLNPNPFYVDVSRDLTLSALDALLTINQINRGGSGEGEAVAESSRSAPAAEGMAFPPASMPIRLSAENIAPTMNRVSPLGRVSVYRSSELRVVEVVAPVSLAVFGTDDREGQAGPTGIAPRGVAANYWGTDLEAGLGDMLTDIAADVRLRSGGPTEQDLALDDGIDSLWQDAVLGR